MKFKLTFSIVLFLIVTCLSGQTILPKEGYFPGTMTYENGIVRTGYVAAPTFWNQSHVWFESDKNGKEEKIKCKDVKSITLQTPNGKTYHFDNIPVCMKEGRKNLRKRWLVLMLQGYATLYLQSDAFVIDKKGNAFSVTYSSNYYPATQTYYIRKKNSNTTYFFAQTSPNHNVGNLNHVLKRTSSWYLSEDKDLVDKIMTKKLTHRDVEEIITIYNDYMEKQNGGVK